MGHFTPIPDALLLLVLGVLGAVVGPTARRCAARRRHRRRRRLEAAYAAYDPAA